MKSKKKHNLLQFLQYFSGFLMKIKPQFYFVFITILAFTCQLQAQLLNSNSQEVEGFQTDSISRADWGAMSVNVICTNGQWHIIGQEQEVIFDESDFSTVIHACSTTWSMIPSLGNDMTVKSKEEMTNVSLKSAKKCEVEYYDAGYKTGIKIILSEWEGLDIKLYMTLCLEGKDEDLVFHVSAEEGNTTIRQLNWPTALNPDDVDYIVLSNWRGVLLPNNWPQAYHPIRTSEKDGSITPTDKSEIQSNK